ncbi:MAG: type 4a pilus biogenesis protein PilO, partial [Myxococcota bacterium]
WFEGLNAREQTIVAVGAGVGGLLVLMLIGGVLSSSIAQVEKRIALKTGQLAEVVRLETEYKAREAERRSRLSELERSNVNLVSTVSDAARFAGFEIGEIRPEQGPPNEEGFAESSVDLQASGLTINRLEKFLTKVEQTRGVVTLPRLEVKKPYRKETLNIKMTVATYKSSKKP